MKKVIIPIIFALVLSTTLALQVDVIPVKDSVYPGEHLVFNLNFTNNESSQLKIDAVTYEGSLSPRPPYIIDAGESQLVTLDIPVSNEAYPMVYSYPVMVRDNFGREWKVEAVGYILYKANEIKIEDLDYKENWDPRQPLLVKTKLVNTKTPKTVDFELRIYDEYGNILSKNATTISLKADEEITLPLELTIPSQTPPGKYEISATVLLYAIPQKRYYVNIIPVEDYTLTKEFKDVFLGKVGKVVLKNTGNVELKNQEISAKMSPLDRLFLISKAKGAKYISGNLVLTGDVEPGQELVLYYRVSYIPLLIIPFILILLGVYFYFLTIKVVVKKEVLDYKHTDDEVDLKVVIRVKNVFNRTLRDVEVFDPLPAFAKDVKDYGTLKGKVERRGYTRYVKWVIEELKPREERILSYHISTRVGIMGKFTLFPAFVEFVFRKKMYTSKSNKVEINIE